MNSRRYTSATPLVSAADRFAASDVNATPTPDAIAAPPGPLHSTGQPSDWVSETS